MWANWAQGLIFEKQNVELHNFWAYLQYSKPIFQEKTHEKTSDLRDFNAKKSAII